MTASTHPTTVYTAENFLESCGLVIFNTLPSKSHDAQRASHSQQAQEREHEQEQEQQQEQQQQQQQQQQQENEQPSICLIRDSARDAWLLPKGRRNTNESRHAAAVREAAEETDYRCQIVPVDMMTRATPAEPESIGDGDGDSSGNGNDTPIPGIDHCHHPSSPESNGNAIDTPKPGIDHRHHPSFPQPAPATPPSIGETHLASNLTDPFMLFVRDISGPEDGAVSTVASDSHSGEVMEGLRGKQTPRVKLIWWYVATLLPGQLERSRAKVSGQAEFGAEFFRVQEVLEKLTYDADREVVRRAVEIVGC